MSFFVQGERIVLKKDGTWMADGTEITHEQTRTLFARSIQWDAGAQRYYLKIGFEKLYIEVEDTAYFVTAVQRRRGGFFLRRSHEFVATLSDGSEAAVEPWRLKYSSGALYLELPGGLKARFLSAPYYDILQDLQEDEQAYYLIVGNKRVDLSQKSEAAPREFAMRGRA